jgi:hypothetical protein
MCFLFSFEFIFCSVLDVKKKNKKKYSESEFVVCIFLWMFFMIKLQRIKKNLMFWLTHGKRLWTNT